MQNKTNNNNKTTINKQKQIKHETIINKHNYKQITIKQT